MSASFASNCFCLYATYFIVRYCFFVFFSPCQFALAIGQASWPKQPKSATKLKSASFEVAPDEKKKFNNYFGTKVDIKIVGNGKGKITIPFHSEEDFNRIVKLIKG